MHNFKELKIFGKAEKKITGSQDKGHNQEVAAYIDAVKTGKPTPISFDDQYTSMLATFKCLESIALKGERIVL